MQWFKSKAKEEPQSSRFASKSEIQAAFAEQEESLYWTALAITGNCDLAKQSIVDAGGLAETNSYVFREWLIRWAQSATARAAAQTVRESIHAAAGEYAHWTCSHSNHELLLQEEVALLRKTSPHDIVRALDPLARAVLILHGCQHASIADCSLLLSVPLRCVLGAYCRALQWLRDLANAPSKVPESAANISCQPEQERDDLDPLFRRKDFIDVIPSK